MKKHITLLFICLTMAACQEEDVSMSPLAGTYHLVSPEIEIGFTVSNDGLIHNFQSNAYVKHVAIPEDQQTNNNITPFDRFKNGYGRIEITSRGTDYYQITLIYNRFSNEGLNVYDVQIDIAGEPFVILPDQVFVKTDQ